jgi:hypothetical protein
MRYYARLNPTKVDDAFLNREEILRLSDVGAQLGFGVSVLNERGILRDPGPSSTFWNCSTCRGNACSSSARAAPRCGFRDASRRSLVRANPECQDALARLLAPNAEHEGGALCVGDHALRPAAGDAVIYPASTIHRVSQVTRGSRFAAVFWEQSLARA